MQYTGEDPTTKTRQLDSERFAFATLDALADHVAVLNARGTIMAVNRAWREFAGANSPSSEGLSEGANYFAACACVTGNGAGDGSRFAGGLRAVIGGELDEFSLEYPCHSPTRQRWFIARATRFEFEGEVRAVVTHADITERKLAEEARRFQSQLLNTVEQAVIATDLSGTITYWNRFAETLYGWPAAEIVGHNIIEITPSSEAQARAAEIMSHLSAGQSWSGEFMVRRRDGTTFPAFVTDTPIYDDEGTLVGIAGISSDTTEHKQAEEERERLLRSLEEERSRLAYLFTQSPAFVAILSGAEHVFEIANPPYLRLIGHRDVLGKGVHKALPEIAGQGYFELLDEVFRSGEPHVGKEMSVIVRHEPDGEPEERFLDFVYQPIFDADGSVSGIFVHGVDITERKRAEEALRESEEWLRAIFDASRDGILVEDGERIAYVNSAYTRLFGYEDADDLKGMHISDVVSDADKERMLDYGRRRARGEAAPTLYEFKGQRKNGELLDLEASVSISNVAGKAYITTMIRDIAERKRVEESLRKSESMYRLLLEQASDGIHTYNLRGDFIETNSKLCQMLGYTREELLRLNVKDLIPAADLTTAPIRFGELQAGKTLLIERWLRRKDGTLIPVEISGRMIQDGVLQSIIRDISERKQAEEKLHKAYDELERRVTERTAELARANETLTAEIAERRRAEETLRENEHRLKIALQTGKLGSWQLDLDTLELDSSEICKANFGLPEDAGFSYRDLLAAIHPEERARVREAIERAIATHSDYHAEYRVVWPDGSTHWIIARGRGIYEPDGEPQRMIGVTVDITERRQAEDTRKELLRRLVTAQEDERRRISRELHDQMGQRLTALMMGLKMLDEESYGRLSALASLQRLQQIIDELSREAHTLAWRLRPAALDDLGLHTALSNYVKDWAERSRVAVDFYSAGVEHARLPLAHETALYRITQEALTNVLKHSRADRVSIILERRADHVLAVVEDNGEGFDVDALTTLSPNESNLGLLGMRERATLLGGTLEIESAPGVGTSVFVRFPLGANGVEGEDAGG